MTLSFWFYCLYPPSTVPISMYHTQCKQCWRCMLGKCANIEPTYQAHIGRSGHSVGTQRWGSQLSLEKHSPPHTLWMEKVNTGSCEGLNSCQVSKRALVTERWEDARGTDRSVCLFQTAIIIMIKIWLGVVIVHICYSRIWDVEAGGSLKNQAWPRLHSEF